MKPSHRIRVPGVVAAVALAVAAVGCAPPPKPPPPKPPAPPPTSPPVTGCSLAAAAFCENFEGARNTSGNRNGDWSRARFSAARWHPDLSSDPDHVNRAQIPACRAGSIPNPLPPGESLVCDPSTSIRSHYGLTSTTVQNYGDNSYRLSQPFDIVNRTGTIDFDVSLYVKDALLGWPAIAFTSDPYSAPSYLADNAGGATPREGLQVQFNSKCPDAGVWTAFPTVRSYHLFRETELRDEHGAESSCTSNVKTAAGLLNHVQVRISTAHLEVWMSDPSADGVHYGPLKRTFSAPLVLTFSRGWVYVGVHNHATMKYGNLPSWTVQWDNIAFDGPRLPAARVSQVNAAATPSGSGIDTGYWLPSTGTAPLALAGVSTAGMTSARVAFDVFADSISNTNWSSWRFSYRLNGKAWHSAALSADEMALMPRASSFSFSLPVDPRELVNGTNTVQFAGSGFYAGYQPFIGNVDLIVQ